MKAAIRRWNLLTLEPFPVLSYNFVASALLTDGQTVVVKVGEPGTELRDEMRALRTWQGESAVRLLDWDENLGALLLERILPGRSLAETWTPEIDEEQTEIIASLMRKLHCRAPKNTSSASRWSKIFRRVEPLPNHLAERADELWQELESSRVATVLLHGDLHHANVLANGNKWCAIDPKGVAGDPALDCYALLHNPPTATAQQLCDLANSRLSTIARVTGMDPIRLRSWGFCGVVMSLCWSVEEGDPIEPRLIELAELLSR